MGKKRVELDKGVELKFTTKASIDPMGISETRLGYFGVRGSDLYTILLLTNN